MSRAVDVGARIDADGVSIKLPRLRVVVEQRQAERLRDVLNTVLPEQITDLMHEPRIAAIEVLRAAQAILAERGQDTENLGHAIWLMEQNATGGATRVRPARLHLLHLWGDVDPELSGPYADEHDRTEAAQDFRRAHGEENGVYRVDAAGDVTVSSFTGAELEMPKLARVPVHVGDRVLDPSDGQWREVMSIDPCGTVNMRDGGVMSVAECEAAEKRLPSEELPS